MRKFIFTILILLLSFSANCQLTVSGLIEPSVTWERKLYVVRIDRIGLYPPVVIDSVLLNEDGSFSYSFEYNPQGILYEFRLPPKGGNYKSLMSGHNDNWFHVISNKKETIKVKSKSDSLYYSAKYFGSDLNDKLLIFQKLKKPIAFSIKQMVDSIKNNPQRAGYFKGKYASIVLTEIEKIKNNIISILDTCKSEELLIAGLYYLNEASLGQLKASEIKKYSDRLKDDEILLVRNLKKTESDIERNRIDLVLPDFTLRDAKKKSYSLHSIKGKFKVMDFWASWCGPCRSANRNQIPTFYNWLSEKNIPFIAITIDRDEEKWKEAIKKDGGEWAQVIEPTYALSRFLDVGAIPLYIVVDENNVVIYEAVTIFQVEAYLKSKM